MIQNSSISNTGKCEIGLRTELLIENIPQELELLSKDAEILNTEFSNKISIWQVWDKAGSYSINSNQYVGVISLPNLTLRLNPKVGISNLFYMLTYAYDLDFFRDENAHYKEISEIYEFIVSIFNKKVTELIQNGIFRYYKETQENINYVKGKISISQNIKQNNILAHRFICIYDEFTTDIVENQIIKYVLYLLSKGSYKNPMLSDEIRSNYYHMEEVSHNVIIPQKFPLINYNKLNQHYEPLHALCRLFINNLSISEKAGHNTFSSFLLNMNTLFEKFIAKLFLEKTKNIKDINVLEKPKKEYYLDNNNTLRLKPDIIIQKDNESVIVLDTKYKKINQSEFKSFDQYQILAYCKGINLKKGILLYPEWEDIRQDTLKIKNSEIEIMVLTINLASEKETFDQNCDDLIKEVLDFA